jgi:hypothetical protein
MISKTVVDLRSEMLLELLSRLPNMDLTEGTPERDLFVEAPIAGQLMTLWQKVIYTAKLHAPHTYTDDLENEDLLNYMSNYGIVPYDATYSTGIVTFYSTTLPTQDIVVPDGTVVRTQDSTPIEFATQGSHTLYQSIASSYYNANTQRWELDCSVQALVSGTESRAGSNTVTQMASSITGVSGITNSDPITGGAAAETIETAMSRVIRSFQGRGLGPTQGLVNYVSGFVSAVNVVGSNDPEMLRDEGVGGCVDFYIIGEDLTDATDDVVITSSGLSYQIDVSYTSTGLYLESQPVREIASLIVNDTVILPEYYELTEDTGLLSKSARGYDRLTVTSSGLANDFYFKDGDIVEVNYIYNATPGTIEDDLNSAANHYNNRDYLVREMTEVTVAVYLEFKEVSGQDFDTVADAVELEISDYINSIKNSGDVEVANIISIAKTNVSVDNVNITTVLLTPTGGGTKTEQGDILFSKNEYPIAGSITIEQWTNG